jgi:TolB-like protein/Flp pilus assembly protein TadD
MPNFLAELRRRNILRVGAAYLIAAWVSIQVADVLVPIFDAPPAMLRVMTIGLALLFPVVLAAAWTFEWTPSGFVRDTGDNIDRQARVRVRRKLDYAILGLSLALVISIVLTRDWSDDFASGSQKAASMATDRRSIAVLPFTNTSGKEDDLPLADGIAETLIHQLGQVKDLRVTARSSSFMFRDEKSDARTIGERLGVSSILDGSVQRSGDKLRIIAQLVDTASGTQLWTAQFDRTLNDVFAMQDEIGRSVIGALQVSLLATETAKASVNSDPGIAAYQAYLQGRREFERGFSELGIAHFERAISLAPDYALAYARLGDAWLVAAEYADMAVVDPVLTVTEPAVMLANAEAAIHRALELDPLLGEAYAALARLSVYNGDDAQAEAAFERAIELNPSYAQAFLGYSQLLRTMAMRSGGDATLLSRAVSMLQRAYELDPLSLEINQSLGHRALDQGDFDLAIRHYRIAIETEPNYPGMYLWIGEIHGENLGRLDEAARWFRRGESSYVGHWATAWLARTYIDMLDIPAAKAAVSGAAPDQSGQPWFLELATLWIARAELDGKATVDAARRMLEEVPEDYMWGAVRRTSRRALAYVLVRNQQCAEAEDLYARELDQFENGGPQMLIASMSFDAIAELGYVTLKCDRAGQAQELLTALVAHLRQVTNTEGYMEIGKLAFVESASLALLQRNDEALTALEHAIDAGFRLGWSDLTDSRRDPRFDSIRDTPRFAALLQRLTEEAHAMRQSFADNPELN